VFLRTRTTVHVLHVMDSSSSCGQIVCEKRKGDVSSTFPYGLGRALKCSM
jgi:hypothetical protein